MINKIAILGDFNPAYPTLNALNHSTRHVQKYLDEKFNLIGFQRIFSILKLFLKNKTTKDSG